MGEAVKNLIVTVNRVCCCCHAGCGVAIYMEDWREQQLRDNSQFFYCVNGHPQHFVESKEQRLEKQLANVKQRLEWAEQSAKSSSETAARQTRIARAYKGKATLMRNRVAKGVCPCCHRYFSKLHAHMLTKHPDFESEPLAVVDGKPE